MKAGVIDVLMYIFSSYADQDDNLPEDRDGIDADLRAAGFDSLEIDKAFDWLDAPVIALFGLIASYFVIQAYRIGEAAVVAPMQYSQIIWAAVYGMFFFGETVDRATWAGAAIIITSGLYIVLRETFGGKSVVNPVSLSRMRPETGTSPRAGVLWWKVRKAKDEG